MRATSFCEREREKEREREREEPNGMVFVCTREFVSLTGLVIVIGSMCLLEF